MFGRFIFCLQVVESELVMDLCGCGLKVLGLDMEVWLVFGGNVL